MIVLNTQRASQEDRQKEIVLKKDTTLINYEDLSNISIEFVDDGKTFSFIVLGLIAIAGIVAAYTAATFELDYNN